MRLALYEVFSSTAELRQRHPGAELVLERTGSHEYEGLKTSRLPWMRKAAAVERTKAQVASDIEGAARRHAGDDDLIAIVTFREDRVLDAGITFSSSLLGNAYALIQTKAHIDYFRRKDDVRE